MEYLLHILVIVVVITFCILSATHFSENFASYNYNYAYNLISPDTVDSTGKLKPVPVPILASLIPEKDLALPPRAGTRAPHPDDPHKHTVSQARELCDINQECSFFTCDPVPISSQSLNCLKTNKCEQQNKCSNPGWYQDSILPMKPFDTPTEQYIKTAYAPSVSVQNTTQLQKDLNQWSNTASPHILGSGLGGLNYTPYLQDQDASAVKNRRCNANHTTTDVNCFVQGAAKTHVKAYVEKNQLSTGQAQTNGADDFLYYKDAGHNLYMKNTDTCCFDSVPEVQKQIRIDNNCDKTGNTSSRELCAPVPSYPLPHQPTTLFGNRRECQPGYAKRNDLGLCVPDADKCSYVNDSVCSTGGKYTTDFKNQCGDTECQQKIQRCAYQEDSPTQVHHCLPGKMPHYTYVGKYNDVVDVSVQLHKMKNDQLYYTCDVIDPHYPEYVTAIQTQTNIGQIKPITMQDIENKTLRVGDQTFNVLNITPSINYIEMRANGSEQVKWYLMNKIKKKIVKKV